ncbi:hypothetical protein ENINCP331B_14540 [Enterobacter intestinihominis]
MQKRFVKFALKFVSNVEMSVVSMSMSIAKSALRNAIDAPSCASQCQPDKIFRKARFF